MARAFCSNEVSLFLSCCSEVFPGELGDVGDCPEFGEAGGESMCGEWCVGVSCALCPDGFGVVTDGLAV